jgi:hypothetical protein
LLDVCYDSDSDQILHRSETTRCANNGLMHRSKQHRYSITSSARACNIFAGCSIEDHRLSHDTGHPCQKSGVSDRHGRSLWAGQSFNLGTELLRERLDDARAEPGFWLSKDAVRLANPLSAIESFQSVPETSYATVICPSFAFSLNACFREFITSSVAINPRLSA